MRRRGFIGSLCSFLVAPKILPEISLPVESGVMIYCPYIPITYSSIDKMLMTQMREQIQDEIDGEIINKLLISAKDMGY